MVRFLTMADNIKDLIERAFGGSLSDILIQIAATLILVVIVRVFLWNRILDYLEKRRTLVAKELDDAKLSNEEAQKLEVEANNKYQDLRKQSKGYLEKAKMRGEEERKAIVSKARNEAKEIALQAEQEIKLEKQKAKADIQNEAVNIATLMASKIIEEEIDEKKYQNLVVKNLESSEEV